MALTSWNPFGNKDENVSFRPSDNQQPIQRLQGEMNRLFQNFYEGAGMRPWSGLAIPSNQTMTSPGTVQPEYSRTIPSNVQPDFGRTFNPCIEVSEDPEKVTVCAELPGIDKEDIELFVNDNSLTITGEKAQPVQGENGYFETERAYGFFRRTIPFHFDVDVDGCEATFEDGVLAIHLPKKGSSKGTKLTIQ